MSGPQSSPVDCCLDCGLHLLFQCRVSPPSLCERYDTISSKVYEDPGTTEEMVALVQFLTKVGLDSRPIRSLAYQPMFALLVV